MGTPILLSQSIRFIFSNKIFLLLLLLLSSFPPSPFCTGNLIYRPKQLTIDSSIQIADIKTILLHNSYHTNITIS